MKTKEAELQERVRAMPIIRRIRFVKLMAKISKQIFAALCDDCKSRAITSGHAHIEYCKQCRAKTETIVRPLYEELKR